MGLFDDSIGDYSFTDPVDSFSFNDYSGGSGIDWGQLLDPKTIDLSNSDYYTDGSYIGSGAYDSLFGNDYSGLSGLFDQINIDGFDLGSLWDFSGGSLDVNSPDYTPFNLSDYTVDGYLKDNGVIDLSNSDYYTDGRLIPTDGSSESSSGTSLSKLLSSLSKMLGGSKEGGILGSQNTNDLVKALLAVMAKRDSNKNQAKNIQTAQQLARSGSQQGLAPNRTGLANLNTDSRDPMSYVQQAPTIQR